MNKTGEMLKEKSFAFAVRIVRLSDVLVSEKQDWVLSKQILKSGTSIGANIRESRFAQSDADFVSKLSIALKEAEETEYWLDLLEATGRISTDDCSSLREDLDWLIGTLVNVVKSMKRKAQLNHPTT